jgi:hypothetical protein
MNSPEPTLIPVMEPVQVSGQISGDRIVTDILSRIRERLESSNSLRSVDSYQSYNFTAEIQLQLRDVDRVEVAASVKAGVIDPSQPVQRVTLQDDVAAEGDQSLEKPIVEAANEGSSQQYERPRNTSGRFR